MSEFIKLYLDITLEECGINQLQPFCGRERIFMSMNGMETTSGLELGLYRRVSLPPRHSIAALLSEISEMSVSQLIVSEQNVLCVCVSVKLHQKC